MAFGRVGGERGSRGCRRSRPQRPSRTGGSDRNLRLLARIENNQRPEKRQEIARIRSAGLSHSADMRDCAGWRFFDPEGVKQFSPGRRPGLPKTPKTPESRTIGWTPRSTSFACEPLVRHGLMDCRRHPGRCPGLVCMAPSACLAAPPEVLLKKRCSTPRGLIRLSSDGRTVDGEPSRLRFGLV